MFLKRDINTLFAADLVAFLIGSLKNFGKRNLYTPTPAPAYNSILSLNSLSLSLSSSSSSSAECAKSYRSLQDIHLPVFTPQLIVSSSFTHSAHLLAPQSSTDAGDTFLHSSSFVERPSPPKRNFLFLNLSRCNSMSDQG